jgi:tRNA 5-methylaminomethyl-2-thiouridine biosynthesis bifunctional protein
MDVSGAVTDANHQHNIRELRQALGTHEVKVVGGRTSLRATTPSRLPHVGQVMEGVYVTVGHGSRGMISAPLAAELIASEICGEPLPVSRALRAALAPR